MKTKMGWRDKLFSGVMVASLIAITILFVQEPTLLTFKETSFVLAVVFALTFFFCGGHSLPNEEKWKTFSKTVTVCLAVSFLVQLILSIFFFIVALVGAYLLAFWVFVSQICDYELPEDSKT